MEGPHTACARCRVYSREQSLRGSNRALETLDDVGQGVADFGLLIELRLEVVEDGRIEKGRLG